MVQKISVRRVELPAATLADPTRVMLQIEYQVGELPPGFVYIDKKDWTKEKEAVLIKEDIDKRMGGAGRETITI